MPHGFAENESTHTRQSLVISFDVGCLALARARPIANFAAWHPMLGNKFVTTWQKLAKDNIFKLQLI